MHACMSTIVYYRDAAARHAPTQVNTTPELAAADIVLDMTSLLGRGGYGIVYSGTLHGDTLVAVKSLFTGGVPTPDLARSPSPSCQPARHCPPASFYLPCAGVIGSDRHHVKAAGVIRPIILLAHQQDDAR